MFSPKDGGPYLFDLGSHMARKQTFTKENRENSFNISSVISSHDMSMGCFSGRVGEFPDSSFQMYCFDMLHVCAVT